MKQSKTSKVVLHFERNLNNWSTIAEISKGTGLSIGDVGRSLKRYSRHLFEYRTLPTRNASQYRLILVESVEYK